MFFCTSWRRKRQGPLAARREMECVDVEYVSSTRSDDCRPLAPEDVVVRSHSIGDWVVHATTVLLAAISAYVILAPVGMCVFALRSTYFLMARLQRRCVDNAGTCEREVLGVHDAVWLHDTPSQPMIVNAVLVFDSPHLSLPRVQELVAERILSHPSLARFLRKLVIDQTSPTGYSWESDPKFDIGRHVRLVPTSEAPHNDAELQVWMGQQATSPLARDRPLWELLLIEYYADGGSALCFRCHHVIGDGIVMSGVLLETLMDPLRVDTEHGEVCSSVCDGNSASSKGLHRAEAHVPRRHRAPVAPLCQRMWWRLAGVLQMPHHIASLMVSPDDYNILHGPFMLSGNKRIAWSRAVPLDAVRKVKDHFSAGCSVNDVLLTATTAALSRYMKWATDESVETPWHQRLNGLPADEHDAIRRATMGDVTLAVPINVRSAREMAQVVLENKFAVIFVVQPLQASNLRTRLGNMVRAMSELKNSSLPQAMFASMQALMKLLPTSWAVDVIDSVADSATCIVTNNRGPSKTLYFDGRACTFWASWAPQRASVGLCLTVYTYAGTVRCSVSADSSCVSDPARLVDMLMEEVEHMADMAEWVPPANT